MGASEFNEVIFVKKRDDKELRNGRGGEVIDQKS